MPAGGFGACVTERLSGKRGHLVGWSSRAFDMRNKLFEPLTLRVLDLVVLVRQPGNDAVGNDADQEIVETHHEIQSDSACKLIHNVQSIQAIRKSDVCTLDRL